MASGGNSENCRFTVRPTRRTASYGLAAALFFRSMNLPVAWLRFVDGHHHSLRSRLIGRNGTAQKMFLFSQEATMSRAFVKEQDVDYLELPERPVSGHPNDVTE